MKKTVKLTESDLSKLISKIIKEGEEPDMSELRKYIPLLQKINRSVNMKEVVRWCNDNDVDYFGMNDLEMIIIYIARNS